MQGLDLFVVGSGPSLHGFDYRQLDGRATLALNRAGVRFHPWIHLFADDVLWKDYQGVEHAPHTVVVCQDNACAHLKDSRACGWKKRIYLFTRTGEVKVKRVDSKLFVSKTVATAAIHLAWKLGAARVFLLGIDGYRTAKRYYADDTRPNREEKGKDLGDGRILEPRHKDWQRELGEVAGFLNGEYPNLWPDRGIYNLSKHSTIGSWQAVAMEEALAASPTVPDQVRDSWTILFPQKASA